MARKSGVDKWRMGVRDGKMILRIESIYTFISVFSSMHVQLVAR